MNPHEEELPIPITSAHAGGHGHNGIHKAPQAPPPPPPPLPSAKEEDNNNNHHHHHHHHHHPHHQSTPQKGVMVVKYRECLKNHAAPIGGNATDGCGEFMPSGEEGTLEALKCSACSCHRNFHRKETEGESPYDCFHTLRGRKATGGAFGYSTANHGLILPRAAPHNMIMTLQTSESDEMVGRPLMAKKRFRTRFTPEQKEKMLSFAERVGWRLQRQEEGVVQQFCQEIGVKRRVLKVWMHNNKHNLAKKTPLLLE